MQTIQTAFTLGKTALPRTAILAPMAGVADRAYRLLCRSFGAAATVSEMVSVKGLCYGVRKPLVAVGSLDALAEVALEDYEAGILSVPDWEHACLCPMVDARRMEVYAQVFDTTGKPLNEVSAEVVDGESFAHFRSQGRPFVIFGSGARKCAGILPDAVLVEVAPSARGLARLAQRALDAGCTEDIAYFEPFYLKDFVVTTSKKKLF